MLCGKQWKSLSIPIGGSKKYNAEKFSLPKERRHFTDTMPGNGINKE
ncbi:MAG: hypothetical protein JST13_08855, partial [Bacteroidetes bacterium]|nr:hypothetical protein [Bacteroidota bacterium]